MPTIDRRPVDLDISAKDMKAVATTQYPTEVLDVTKDFAFVVVIDIVATVPGTLGIAKLTLNRYAKDKTTLIDTLDVLTAIDTDTSQQVVLKWGYGVTAKVTGSIVTLDTDVDMMDIVGFLEIVLEVVAASDSTTSVASVTLLTERL